MEAPYARAAHQMPEGGGLSRHRGAGFPNPPEASRKLAEIPHQLSSGRMGSVMAHCGRTPVPAVIQRLAVKWQAYARIRISR